MTTVTSALLRMPAASARWPVGDLREAAGKPGATRFAGAVEIEEQTAYAARGAAVEHGLGGLRGVDHRDAAAARPENIEALEQHGVVRAIEARLHDDEAFDAARCGAAALFDLKAHFFAPTRIVQMLSRAGAVKVGRRSDISSRSGDA